MCAFGFSKRVHVFPLFLFFYFFCFHASKEDKFYCLETIFTIYTLFCHCNSIVHTLKNIKNGSHDTIYTFKNYFVTVFSVFSFNNNKINPNGPYIWIAFKSPCKIFFSCLLSSTRTLTDLDSKLSETLSIIAVKLQTHIHMQ